VLGTATATIRKCRCSIKHWTKKSVRPIDITETLTEISLWEPPVIQSLIIATSGRFTADAVALVEKHNNEVISAIFI
jgi:hypothetical protein